ncbi:MAG TPA: hypothetical protein PKD86_01765 [Gemmatales bacterium]|nr:hypothetical protein [Gemmatales bacterium]HMP58054.1 hypothetical protein [Gemmatales bacterium]
MPKTSPPSQPLMLAMVICDTVIDDRISGKKSLIGLFDAIATTNLPCRVNELHVFVALTEGYGKRELRMRCISSESDEELFGTTTDIEFPDPLSVVELNLGFRGCEFPEAGEYRFQLFIEQTLLCERKFRVTQVPGFQPGAPGNQLGD